MASDYAVRFPRDPRPLVLGAFVAFVVAFATYSFVSTPGPASSSGLPTRFTVNGKTFDITYTATNATERAQGLMNKKVTNTTTMLFVFPSPGYYSFWMYDTNTSLDLMWINATGSTGTVVFVVRNAPSCYSALLCANYTPSAEANYVIEAKAGFAAANGVAQGTKIAFS